MTMYRPVHKSGATALPRLTMTAANLWIISNHSANLKDWKVELVAVPENEPDETFIARIQAYQAAGV